MLVNNFCLIGASKTKKNLKIKLLTSLLVCSQFFRSVMICLDHYHIKESCKARVELNDQNKMLKLSGGRVKDNFKCEVSDRQKKNKPKQRQVLRVYHNDTFSFI